MALTQNDRVEDELLLLEQFFSGRQSQMWTAMPAIVQAYEPSTLTCTVQVAIQGRVEDSQGNIRLVTLPQLLKCPVVFPHAGGCSITFPIKQGDECLVVFASRAIDFWWQNGGIQPAAEPRMHDLSDGFVILAPYSQKKKIGSPSTSEIEIRSDDGSAKIALNPSTHTITIIAPNDLNITGDVNITGTVTVTEDVNASGISLNSHTHGGVSTGPNSTGGPQ